MSWAEKALIVILASMVGVIYFLSDSINSKNEKIKQLNNDLMTQAAITADYEKRINSLHELDTKHTTELTNAKAEIDQLRIDVINGTKRLRIKAECPKPENSSTSSVDASGSPSLARDAEQDYFDLLKQLETLEKQYLGLRDYYYAECKR
ncbi:MULTISPECIES: lysis protein [Providencia]|uniref:lysis protein n=2 Tax=Morganellaceae TaxID=1903414 RepID=UPI00234B512F|nr:MULTISPECIES: lysis protein [Providencia]MDH2365450.1 lysis protein [Providencia rettgeri]